MGKSIDITNQRFGRLVALRLVGRNPVSVGIWLCQCDCGNIKKVLLSNLRAKHGTISCGCARRFHGKHKTPEYVAWVSMLQRCNNPQSPSFHHYGGRGITVCERWLKFENFLADIGPRPSPELSLQRINNDLGYFSENCKWATRKEQASNMRNPWITSPEAMRAGVIKTQKILKERRMAATIRARVSARGHER